MRKKVKQISICLLVAVFFWCGTLISDRQRLQQELIRLHIVADSDNGIDQFRKLRVRDAVINSLWNDLNTVTDVDQAWNYLQKKLPAIQKIAEETLLSMGCEDIVSVSLCQESFDTRKYETFMLPSGIYKSLRIVIGDGAGKNWWCVAFPELCIPEASEGVADIAAGAGFPEPLRNSLIREKEYTLRFWTLDLIGKLENILMTP